jgi:hypothetical protein
LRSVSLRPIEENITIFGVSEMARLAAPEITVVVLTFYFGLSRRGPGAESRPPVEGFRLILIPHPVTIALTLVVCMEVTTSKRAVGGRTNHMQTTAETFQPDSLHMHLWPVLFASFILDKQADNLLYPYDAPPSCRTMRRRG